MSIRDEDITILPADTAPEGPQDSGAGEPADPEEHDGGADGGADTEGPQDAGAGEEVDPAEQDGGADSGA
jgi:hypothetical protein